MLVYTVSLKICYWIAGSKPLHFQIRGFDTNLNLPLSILLSNHKMNFSKMQQNENLCISLSPPTPSKKVTPATSIELNLALSRNTPIYYGSDSGSECLGKTSLTYNKSKEWKQRQKQNILEAIQVLNGPLANKQWGRTLDLGGWPCFDQWLKSKGRMDSGIIALQKKLIGPLFFHYYLLIDSYFFVPMWTACRRFENAQISDPLKNKKCFSL